MSKKRYDAEYFRRWYHDPRRRIIAPSAVERKVRLVVGIAEALLERRIRTVLDVGAGEGAWRAYLRRLRPRVHYVGVESSSYAVARFARSRGLRQGSFGTLGTLGLDGPFDLVVACDVLHYVPDCELVPGLATIRDLLGGLAYLEAYTTADAIEGDRGGWHHRSPARYRQLLRRADLHPVGMHCYVGPSLADAITVLERGAW